ncbi:MAG: UvrD-helicase domain-containing protein [Deltaproteobacteria bacterium]|nr:UvrD-helicase domain-containing protein [Deltaproteobacteria bacterium]
MSVDEQLHGLNESQRAAVFHRDGPLLVLAGAGSGKTRVVTLRIARLLLSGESPKSILAVTFTNKASKEMKARLVELCGNTARGVFVSTFHALCARLLRRDAHRIGLSPNFAILDEGDQRAQLMHTARALDLKLTEKEPRLVLSRIGLWKNNGLRTDKTPLESPLAGRVDEIALLAAKLWTPYASHLRALSAVDFDDLLLYARELLEQVPDVKKRYQALFKFLHIDEYQDTNPLQLDIVRLLCGPHRNLAVVGDDDQAIYGFRGADIENILAFDKNWAPCAVVKLEENYRSSGHILAAANAVIGKNTTRKDKTLYTRAGNGTPIDIIAAVDGDVEADTVGARIWDLWERQKVPAEEIAILYRSGPQSRLFEEALRLRGVPYRVVGGMEFFQRKEVKDTLASLACICRPDEEMAFRRVVNLPARGLGEKAVATFIAWARELKLTLMEAAATAGERAERTGLKPPQEQTLRDFARPLLAARAPIQKGAFDEDADVAGIARSAVLAAGLQDLIHDESDLEKKERLKDTIDEVINAFAGYVDKLRSAREAPDLEESGVVLGEIGPDGVLAAFLDKLSLDEDKDKDERDDEKKHKGKVQLMSLHASKGLEFPHVFLVGLEEGLLPHRRVLEEGGLRGVEEERRLAYVGITRARRVLTLSFAQHRKKRHEMVSRKKSRFLEDIPTTCLEPTTAATTAPIADSAAAFFAVMKGKLG